MISKIAKTNKKKTTKNSFIFLYTILYTRRKPKNKSRGEKIKIKHRK